MKSLTSFVLSLLCLALVVGCGSSAESGGEPAKSAVGTTAANGNSAPAAVAATAEQIVRWTPAAFEPLELLGIYEWEKTSFTSRIAALPDGKHFIAAGSRVILWSLDDTKTPAHVFLELTDEDGDRHLQALAVAPDGKWFAVGDSEGTLRVWSLTDKSEIATKQLYTNDIQDLAISPDGKEIATISYDSEITIWSVPEFNEKKKFEVTTKFVKQLEYVAPQVLAVAGETISAWNTSTGKLDRELSADRYCTALARSPDGMKFVFGGDEKLVIWDIQNGKAEAEITQEVSGREQIVFSPDGKYLAANSGGTVQLWNLAERRITQVIEGFGWAISDVCWLPETNLLAIASEIGVTRIWGTAQQGAAVGLKPLHPPLAKYDVPATPVQKQEVLDLRVLPRMPESEMSVVTSGNLNCIAPASTEEAKTFYRHFLNKAGWQESATPSANPMMLVFEKDDFRVTASFYDAGDGKTNVMINHGGNLDLREIPKFDAAPVEIVYENEDTVSYRAKADLLTLETGLLRLLHKAGWIPYTRLNTSHNEPADARDMDFLKNGTTLKVSVGKFPDDRDSYTISYSLFPNTASVPVLPDAGYVEFDGSTDPKLIATTGMTLEEARDFYDQEMAREGWIIRLGGHTMKEEYAWLSYLRDQSNVVIGVTKLENGKTLVRVGESNGSLWEGSLPPEEEEEGDEEETEIVGIEAADFPILNASKTAKYDPLEKTIEVQIDGSTLANAAEIYTKAIEALGWKHDGRGIRGEDYTFLTYEKGDVDFSLRAHSKDGNALVNFGGDGLLWTKPLPGAKEVVSFERWLRLNKLPPDLSLLDRYEAEMRAVGKP